MVKHNYFTRWRFHHIHMKMYTGDLILLHVSIFYKLKTAILQNPTGTHDKLAFWVDLKFDIMSEELY